MGAMPRQAVKVARSERAGAPAAAAMLASVSGSAACAAMYSSALFTQAGATRGGEGSRRCDVLCLAPVRRAVKSASRSAATMCGDTLRPFHLAPEELRDAEQHRTRAGLEIHGGVEHDRPGRRPARERRQVRPERGRLDRDVPPFKPRRDIERQRQARGEDHAGAAGDDRVALPRVLAVMGPAPGSTRTCRSPTAAATTRIAPFEAPAVRETVPHGMKSRAHPKGLARSGSILASA